MILSFSKIGTVRVKITDVDEFTTCNFHICFAASCEIGHSRPADISEIRKNRSRRCHTNLVEIYKVAFIHVS